MYTFQLNHNLHFTLNPHTIPKPVCIIIISVVDFENYVAAQ